MATTPQILYNETQALNLMAPSGELSAVTPHDTNLLAKPTVGVWVGTTGNLTVIDIAGNTVTLTAVPDGCFIPMRVKIIKSTATTASNIVAFF